MFAYDRIGFPSQKKSTKSKNKKWRIKCVKAGAGIIESDSNSRRMTREARMTNVDLYNGILDEDDIVKTVDPFGITPNTLSTEMRHYPIANSKINVLVGEEAKRPLDYKTFVTNDSAVSEKEDMIHEKILSVLEKQLDPNSPDALPEDKLKEKIKQLGYWKQWEAQDVRERMASHILSHDYEEQKFSVKFNRGFLDVALQGEEIYCAEVIGEKPRFRKCSPENITFSSTGDSNYIEDADVIVEERYLPVGQIIDEYYDHLTEANIKKLEGTHAPKGGTSGAINYDLSKIERYVAADQSNSTPKGVGYETNEQGEIRVVRVVWKSRRKLGELTYYDEDGEKQKDIVDENYESDKTKGEKIQWLWVNEWWEGTQIMDTIYVKMEPRPIQFRRMDNLSIAGSGYVGTMYGTALMEYMKPYNYMYDAIAYKTNKEIKKFKGPMIEMDFAKIPDKWDPQKWLYYGEEMGYLAVDSFKEGDEGAATGKLAGAIANTSGKHYNPDLGSFISQNIELLQYLDSQLGAAVGITPQREGSISNRETVGGVERSVAQSSHSTEQWFLIHDETKIRALEVYLETAKYAYRNKNMKVQNILDDLSSSILEIDGQQFVTADYGIVISDSKRAQELYNAMKELGKLGLQSGTLQFKDIADIYLSSSISETRRKIEKSENEAIQRKEQSEQAQRQLEKEVKMREIEIKNRELALNKYKIDQDNATKMAVQEMKEMGDIDKNNNGIRDRLDAVKIQADIEQKKAELEIKREELQLKRQQSQKEIK